MVDGRRKGAPSERRREEREPIVLVVEYEGVDDLVGDFTENLSTGGTFVHTEREFAVGTGVRLMLSFPGLLKPIAIDGVVRWSREAGEEEPGVGIEFTSFEEGGHERLQQVIGAVRDRDPDYVGRLINVLVVEDNPHVAKLIREGLGSTSGQFKSNLAFNFRTASDGRHALELLESEPFDAVIVDIYLPVLDGSQVIAELRSDERFRHMPVIAVSAGGEAARKLAIEAGADFFLEKPMRLRQVIESMKRLIQLEES